MRLPTSVIPLHLSAITVVLLCSGGVHAQHATERYIPIGQSPGLSGTNTYIGKIRDVEEATYTLVVRDENGGRQKIRVTPTSEVWVDRSKRRRSSLKGSFEDCRKGRRVEVLLRPDSGEAAWVKVEGR